MVRPNFLLGYPGDSAPPDKLRRRQNVHPELEEVLKRIHTRDILDLALGCEGQYFLKYREGSAVRQGARSISRCELGGVLMRDLYPFKLLLQKF